MKKDIQILIRSFKEKIMSRNQNMISRIYYQYQNILVQNEINISRFEGDNIINSIVREIVKEQNNGRVYTDKEKEDLFEEGFSEALKKIEEKVKLDNVYQNER